MASIVCLFIALAFIVSCSEDSTTSEAITNRTKIVRLNEVDHFKKDMYSTEKYDKLILKSSSDKTLVVYKAQAGKWEIVESESIAPPPPPPPPPAIEAVTEVELMDEEDDIEFVDQSVDANTYIDAPVFSEKSDNEVPPPPPPPPPPPEPEVEEIFKVVEEMPRFPGCEEMMASADEKRMCANRKMLEFIYENIKYPSVARDNNIEGTVVISFVVDEKGVVSDAQVVRDIGGGCGAEALRIVEMMNDMPERWTPGKQRGRAVKVLFNLPVKFRLELK